MALQAIVYFTLYGNGIMYSWIAIEYSANECRQSFCVFADKLPRMVVKSIQQEV